MRDRHWDVIADETGIEVSSDSTATLKYLLDSDIMETLPRVVEISDIASREWSIEKVLSKMFEDWAPLELGLSPWKDSGVHIVRKTSLLILLHAIDRQFGQSFKQNCMGSGGHVCFHEEVHWLYMLLWLQVPTF